MELGKDDQGLMTEGGGAGVSVWFARAAGTKSTKQWAALVVVVQSLSRVRLLATPWTAACQVPCPSPTPRVHSDSRPLSQ